MNDRMQSLSAGGAARPGTAWVDHCLALSGPPHNGLLQGSGVPADAAQHRWRRCCKPGACGLLQTPTHLIMAASPPALDLSIPHLVRAELLSDS